MSIELLDLPDIVLEKILRFVPDRFELATVCRRFYEIVCEIEKNSMTICIGVNHFDESVFNSIINSIRRCKIMLAYLDVKTPETAGKLKEIFRHHGASIKKLGFTNWEKFIYSESTLFEIFNFFPNLEELELSSWGVEIIKDESLIEENSLKLENLRKIIFKDCHEPIFDFMRRFLPKDIISHLALHCHEDILADTIRQFTKNQTKIESFDGSRDFEHGNFLELLKLSSLTLRLYKNFEENNDPLRPVLRDLVKSQPNLKYLDILDDNDYEWKLVNDEIFLEICKIKSLEELKLNFSAVAPACIQNFSNLTNLKRFETLTCTVQLAREAFNEMSLVETVPIERFVMRLWDEDLPAQVFEQFGENYKFLKHLEIKLGIWHKLNIFIEGFPHLETLKIRFGEANNNVDFANVYRPDGFFNENIKNLSLGVHGKGVGDIEMFFKMMRAFPNLEKFDMQTKLPFSEEFFQGLVLNLGKIQELELTHFDVPADIVFSNEGIENLKKLSKKLKYGFLQICSTDDSFWREKKSQKGKRTTEDIFWSISEPETGEATRADFEPLKAALEGHYKIHEDEFRRKFITYHYFLLSVGKQSEW